MSQDMVTVGIVTERQSIDVCIVHVHYMGKGIYNALGMAQAGASVFWKYAF